MKKHFILPVIFCALLLTSCKPGNVQNEHQRLPTFTGSSRFTIADSQNYKIIHVFAETNSSIPSYSYVLYHRGTHKPELKIKAQFVETPVRRVACLSNIFVGCLQKLNLEDRIAAVDNISYVCNPVIRSAFTAGTIKELAKTGTINIEETILLKPELILTFGTGDIENDIDKRLPAAGIPVALSVDHYETTPLARAAWLRFVAAFFEKSEVADSILAVTEKNYNSLRQLTIKIPARPKVITEIKSNDTWYVPGGKSFMARLLEDAGADYFWKNDTSSGSLALSYEEVLIKASAADFWLNVHQWNSMEDCLKQDERNSEFKAYRNKQIYNNNAITNGEGGNAYWENGLLSPDEILKDLIAIFHPELLPDHQLKYYRKLN